MSFFAELKRRNVFKVGIAYVVAAWLILQLTEVLSELMELHTDIGKVVIILLVVGFVPALIFAWAFEMTPEGVKREKDVDRSQSITPQTGRKLDFVIIGMLAIGMAYFFWESRLSQRAPEQAQPAGAAGSEPLIADVESPAVIDRQSIAVLPFNNRSRQADDEPFVEGVHDDLLTNLARIGSLKVISRTSVLQYKDTNKPIPEIAGELGVATVMEGAVQRSGNTVRINVQLIDAQTDEHLWAEIFDRQLTAENLFAIQSEIAEAIADALEATLSPEERERINALPTDNLAALDAFQRGRQLVATRLVTDIEAGIQAYSKAVAIDPQFALAWVGLADAHIIHSAYGAVDGEETFALVEKAVEKAMAIDPDLGEAHASMAQVYEQRGQLDAMEAAYRKAIELSPNYARGYHWYSNSLRNSFPLRTRDVLDLARRAVDLDPKASIITNNLANAYAAGGLYSLAERQARKTLELDPDFVLANRTLSFLLGVSMGRLDEAIMEMRRAREREPEAVNNVFEAVYWAELGDLEKAGAVADQVADRYPNDWRVSFSEATINARKGNIEGLLETAARMRLTRGDTIFASYRVALFKLALGEPKLALDHYLTLDPGWRQPSEWTRLAERWPDHACYVAWALGQNGEAGHQQHLLEIALRIHAEVLPTVTEHPGEWRADTCYLQAGDGERALAEFERQVAHGHLMGLWAIHQLPLYDAIRHEPRYQAAWTKYQDTLAAQRAKLARSEAGL